MKKLRDLDSRDGIYRIEPQDAVNLLANTAGKNRKIRPGIVARYRSRMAADEWVVTGEPIILTHGGKFPADGRHRLSACIGANKPFDAVILHCNGESYKWEAMGQCRSRSLDDVLSANGEKYNKLLATTLRYLIRHDRAREGGFSMFSHSFRNESNVWNDIENRQGESYLEEHPKIREWVAEFGGTFPTNGQIVPYSSACCIFCLLKRQDQGVMEFFTPLMSGENLAATDPRLALRKRFYRERNERAVGAAIHRTTEYSGALILKAYKVWRAKGKATSITFKTGETYPFATGKW